MIFSTEIFSMPLNLDENPYRSCKFDKGESQHRFWFNSFLRFCKQTLGMFRCVLKSAF